jgi:hypothetical protein
VPPVRQLLGIAAAGAVLLAACGDDDDGESDAEGEAYVEAVVGSMRDDDEAPPLDEAQQTCVATAIVDVVGVDALQAADITPAEFGDADELASLDIELREDATSRLGAALGECDIAGPAEDLLIDAFTVEFGAALPPDGAACLAENLDDRALADDLAAFFVDRSDDVFQGPLLEAVGACPSVATAVLLAEAPTDLSPEAEACVTAFIEGNRELVAESFAAGSAGLGEQIALACPEAFAGAG